MGTATYIKHLDGFNGEAALYEVSEPVKYDKPYDEDDEPAKETKYVIASAAVVMFSGSETYLFPASAEGEVLSWHELDGSMRGTLSHQDALENAGYTVQP